MWSYLCYLVFPVLSAEVITLVKDNNVTCVLTEESRNVNLSITHFMEVINPEYRDMNEAALIKMGWNKKKKTINRLITSEGIFYPYLLMYSNKTSTSTTDYINIDSSDCISMYIRVDPGCYLDIYLKMNNLVTKETRGGNTTKDDLKKWRKVEIKTHGTKVNKLYIRRYRQDSLTFGYWAIRNIRNCDQIVTYKTILKNTNSSNHIFQTLRSSNRNDSGTTCELPYIGKNCSLKCSDVLGSTFPNCENHRICNGYTCHCAWGYEGANCDQSCQIGKCGLDCNQTCNRGCDPQYGCQKCREKFVGDQCSEELPVVLRPPEIISLIDNTIQVRFFLGHNTGESKPDSYVIQYRELDATESFLNYSSSVIIHSQDNLSHVEDLQDKISRNRSYEVRVILIYKNQYFENDIPTLQLFKKSLSASHEAAGDISLTWNAPNKFTSNYTVKYNCTNEFCSININSERTTTETTLRISTFGYFSKCDFILIANHTSTIDSTSLPQSSITEIDNSELPKEITFHQSIIEIKLSNCENFHGPLTYDVEYACTSDWCTNKTKQRIHCSLEKYNNSIQVEVNLQAYANYNVTVIAKRQNQVPKEKVFANISSPPKVPLAIEQLSTYARNNSLVFLKWKKPYPPRGMLEKYKMIINDTDPVMIETEDCNLWKDFTCSNISVLNNGEKFNITIQAKNQGVDHWGKAKSFIINSPTKLYSLEDLRIYFTLNSSIESLWGHPVYIYVDLENVPIELKDEKLDKNVFLMFQEHHNYTIPVAYCKNCTATVCSIANQTASLFMFGLNPVTEISQAPFFILYNKSSSWLLSKNYEDLNTEDQCRFLTNFSKNNNSIPLKLDVQFSRTLNIKPSSESKINIIIIISGALIVIILLGFVAYKYNSKTSVPRNEKIERKFSNVQERTSLIEQNQIHCKNASHIQQVDTVDFKNYVLPTIEVHTDNNKIPELDTESQKSSSESPKRIEIEEFENYLLGLIDEDADQDVFEEYNKTPKIRMFEHNYDRLCSKQNIAVKQEKNIYPYNDTVVYVQENEDIFLNANYVDGYNTQETFIAAQAPLPSTIHSFWNMVCQQKAQAIIMLTDLRNTKRIKCEKYWPSAKNRFRYGAFLVENIKQIHTSTHVYRELRVTYKDEAPIWVKHFQFTQWPDDNIPKSLNGFVDFIKETMRLPHKSHIIVHGNAGCGSFAGTFILCDLALRMAIHKNRVDLLKLLKEIRDQRPHMVETLQEYLFAHLVVWYYFYGQDFSIPILDNFQVEVERALEEVTINKLNRHLTINSLLHKKIVCNTSKSEGEDNADHRLSDDLQTSSTSECIASITLSCFKQFEKLLIVQQPMYNMTYDFWKLSEEEKIDTIISLNAIAEDDLMFPKFWPDAAKKWTLDDKQEVHFLGEEDSEVFKSISIEIDKIQGNLKQAINMRVVQLKNWKRETMKPTDLADLIYVWKEIMQSSNKIVVMCHDGITACGLFTALGLLLENINQSNICDVFSAVSTVRQAHPQFVEHCDQIKFLYEAAIVYTQIVDAK